jgi:hypothetical protein
MNIKDNLPYSQVISTIIYIYLLYNQLISMNINEYQRISMNINEYLQISMNIYKIYSLFNDIYIYIYIYIYILRSIH